MAPALLRRNVAGAALLACLAALACKPAPENGAAPAEGDAARGKRVYLANCVSCHAADPIREGPLGPPVAGASLALLSARILRNEYPPGYVPKRSTRIMLALPFLQPNLRDLEAFLADPVGAPAGSK